MRAYPRPSFFRAALSFAAGLALLSIAVTGHAVGTLAGTDIDNTASIQYELAGTPLTQSSNTVTITVAETLDVALVLQSPQVTVASDDVNQALIYTVTNTGNGQEAFQLSFDNSDTADDFDPVAATPAIYFDTDNSGDFSVGDTAYTPGTNDPLLDADQSIVVILVNDIPSALNNGDVGRSALQVEAITGSGTPGTVIAGGGVGGVDAVIGTSGAIATVIGEYVVSDVAVSFVKAAAISDPLGGTQPVPGATITYTITLEVTGTGTATALAFSDPIPANTTYVGDSLTLNGAPLSDSADGDAGALDTTGAQSTVTVQLGDLDAAGGVQTIVFSVLID